MRVSVTFTLELPVAATPTQIQEWLNFELGANGSMQCNPLDAYDINADPGSVEFRTL
jgi:hypothetical protein